MTEHLAQIAGSTVRDVAAHLVATPTTDIRALTRAAPGMPRGFRRNMNRSSANRIVPPLALVTTAAVTRRATEELFIALRRGLRVS